MIRILAIILQVLSCKGVEGGGVEAITERLLQGIYQENLNLPTGGGRKGLVLGSFLAAPTGCKRAIF